MTDKLLVCGCKLTKMQFWRGIEEELDRKLSQLACSISEGNCECIQKLMSAHARGKEHAGLEIYRQFSAPLIEARDILAARRMRASAANETCAEQAQPAGRSGSAARK